MKTILVKGMQCRHCAMAVEKSLSAVAGVGKISVQLETGEVSYEENGPVDLEQIIKAVRKAGYRVDGA